MIHSEEIGEIAKAFCAAQGALEPAPKTGENPHFRSKYTPLPEIVKACREVLKANGLAVSQTFRSGDDNGLTIMTMLIHESGQWLQGELTMPVVKATPQAIGSTITYGRRYALAAMLGIVSDDDDDAEATEGRNSSKPKASDTPTDDPLEGIL